MRRNLLVRLLVLSLSVAVLAISATAWLSSTGTSQRLRGEFERTLEADSFVYQELLFYAQNNDSWGNVGTLVDDLSERTGRRVAVTSPDGRVLADSSGGGQGSGPLPSTPTAEIDAGVPAQTAFASVAPAHGAAARARGEEIIMSTVPLSSWRLTEDEASRREALAQEATACAQQVEDGAEIMVAEDGSVLTVSGAPAATAPPSTDADTVELSPCIPEGLSKPSAAAMELNDRQTELARSCLDDAGLPYRQAADEFGLTSLTPTSADVPEEWHACMTDARAEALEPYVADPALLYTGSTDRFDAFSGNGWTRTVLTGLAVLALSAAVTVLAGRRLTHPIRSLTAAAEHMRSGGRNTRVEVSGQDEVAKLGHAFNAMAESIEASERQRKAMVGDVAHELRTPLANVRGYLEAAEDGVVALDDALVSSLLEESSLLQRLIDDLQDLALADAGKLRMHPERTDVAELARQVIAAHRASAERAAVELALDANVAVDVDADPGRLRQALGNLVGNAVQYTPDGGHVRVTVSADGDDVVLAIADDGPGIAAEHLPHLFERFYRTDTSRTRATGGSGLGLAITRHLVEAHGGTVDVTSTEGAGSVFTIRMPVRDRDLAGRER